MGLACLIRSPKLAAIIGSLLWMASLSAQTPLDPKAKGEVLSRVTAILSKRAFVPGVDFTKWPEYLKDEKSEIDGANSEEEFQSAVNSALHKFGASHVFLMTPRIDQSRRSGKTVGIGISARLDPNGKGLYVSRVYKDGPAEKAGITQGDLVTEVDGKSATNLRGIKGEEGSQVALTVVHQDGKSEEYKITRQNYSTVWPPELIWIDRDTAQLKVSSFDTGYDRHLIEDLVSQAQTAKNLILDLRDNGGGAVANLQHLLGMLIPKGLTFGSFINRSTVNEFVAKTGGKPNDLAAVAQWSDDKLVAIHSDQRPFFNGRIAVLVNGLSGSASEIGAAALHDTVGAPIIGTHSAGAVLASMIVSASNGFTLQVPFEDYVTSKGVRLEGTGVSPDVEVKELFPPTHDAKDTSVEKACEYFTQTRLAGRV